MARLVALCSLGMLVCCGDPGADGRPETWGEPAPSIAIPADSPGDDGEQAAAEGAPDDVLVGACKHELERECRVTLKERNSIKTCMVGEQRCENGAWTECKFKGHEKGDKGQSGAGGEQGS